MEEKDLFTNAKFGDAFQTVDGRTMIFHKKFLKTAYLICEEFPNDVPYHLDGTCINDKNTELIKTVFEMMHETHNVSTDINVTREERRRCARIAENFTCYDMCPLFKVRGSCDNFTYSKCEVLKKLHQEINNEETKYAN